MPGANMRNDIDQTLTSAYNKIQQTVPSARIDSLEVVKQVEEYRQYWKPQKTKAVLLAESHVYTDEEDSEIKLNKSILRSFLPDYPLRFVRFIYCLGYGENELLSKRAVRNHQGTPSFWKIFSHCVSEEETKVLKMSTWKKTPENLRERLGNKVRVLRKMKENGIWLLDSSIVGLTKVKRVEKKRIIEVCWREYISDAVKELKPEQGVVIGHLVEEVLSPELEQLEFRFEMLGQPRGKSVEYYQAFTKICSKYR